jgi:hypothetical protein
MVTAEGLKKKSPMLTLAMLEARAEGEEAKAHAARPASIQWNSRAPGAELWVFLMTFLRLFTVFRCGFDCLKADDGFLPEQRSPDADRQPLARDARS